MKQQALKEIATQVKNPDLVERRRHQIVDAAVQLFIENGFHKTTTPDCCGRRIFNRLPV